MKPERKIVYQIALWFSILGTLAVITDFGFNQNPFYQHLLDIFYFIVLGLSTASTVWRYVRADRIKKRKVLVFDLLSIGFTLWLFYHYLFEGVPFKTDLLLEDPIWIRIAVLLSFIREVSEVKLNYKTLLNPAQVFVISFMAIIILGTLLLLLPNATYEGLSFVDALFTSTSAVCVTGLIVVDTGSYFTPFGQYIILFLIQVGGIGILTFASYFSYFFKGASTYEDQLFLSDLTNSNKIGEVFSTLKYILLTTFAAELIAGCLIYGSLDASLFETEYERVFFAVFHAISSFCNAGFSTLSQSLYDVNFRFNYLLQLSIVATFIFGGLGFPIVANSMNFLKYQVRRLIPYKKHTVHYKPWVLNLNTRINLITTSAITVIAVIVFFLLEYNNTLAEHNAIGKVVTAFFSAATPRTAGFNSIDISAMLFPTTMVIFLLMWIGASPGSTGGGVKTSTLAISVLNILSLAQGKKHLEVFRREIASISIRRSYAIISLSLIVIGFSITLISFFDSEKHLVDIAFECFSAYSTVGLSLGITADLSVMSKLVIIFTMFVGRVSMLTVVIAIFKKIRPRNFEYPTEEIIIN